MSRFVAASRHLKKCDPRLSALMERVGPCRLTLDPDPWRSLSCSIISQQISTAAARTIRARVAALEEGSVYPSPRFLLSLPEEVLRAAGLSANKQRSIRDLAEHFVSGRIDPSRFASMDDEAIIEMLLPVRGIGRWTAEMFLLFSLGRPDVFAVADLGIRRGISVLLGREELPEPAEMIELAERWRPWRSIASWYLWRAAELKPAAS